MRMKTLNFTEKFYSTKKINLPFQICVQVLLGKRTENPYFISKYMVFYLLAKFFHFTSQRKGEQENVRFIINEDTVLNIIADYGKVIVNTFERDDIEQLNIV
jgi:hypothetical protein